MAVTGARAPSVEEVELAAAPSVVDDGSPIVVVGPTGWVVDVVVDELDALGSSPGGAPVTAVGATDVVPVTASPTAMQNASDGHDTEDKVPCTPEPASVVHVAPSHDSAPAGTFGPDAVAMHDAEGGHDTAAKSVNAGLSTTVHVLPSHV